MGPRDGSHMNGLVLPMKLENVCLFAHVRIGAVTSAGVEVAYCPRRFPKDTRWSSDGWYELRGLPWELQHKNRDMRDNLADDGAPVLAPPHRQTIVYKDIQRATPVRRSDISKYGTAPGCRACTFVFREVKSRTSHSDERRQGIMEAVEEEDEDRMRAFLDRNVPRRTAAVVIGGGSAEPAVVEPAEIPVRTSGAASSSSSGGAQPSPMASVSEGGAREDIRVVQRKHRQASPNNDKQRESDVKHQKNPVEM